MKHGIVTFPGASAHWQGNETIHFAAGAGEEAPHKLWLMFEGTRLDIRPDALADTAWFDAVKTTSLGTTEIESGACPTIGDVSLAVGVDAFVTDTEIRGSSQGSGVSGQYAVEFRYRR